MADKIICYYPECDQPGTRHVTLQRRGREYEARLCADHELAMGSQLHELGMRPLRELRGKTSYKSRDLYVAASGEAFTTAEARPWLVERGLAKPTSGRPSVKAIEAYAEAH